MFALKSTKEMKRDIEELKTKVKQLECPHPIESLSVCLIRFDGYQPVYGKKCGRCEKILQTYICETEALINKNVLLADLIKINDKKIKGL